MHGILTVETDLVEFKPLSEMVEYVLPYTEGKDFKYFHERKSQKRKSKNK